MMAEAGSPKSMQTFVVFRYVDQAFHRRYRTFWISIHPVENRDLHSLLSMLPDGVFAFFFFDSGRSEIAHRIGGEFFPLIQEATNVSPDYYISGKVLGRNQVNQSLTPKWRSIHGKMDAVGSSMVVMVLPPSYSYDGCFQPLGEGDVILDANLNPAARPVE